jgi:hypothetical protein
MSNYAIYDKHGVQVTDAKRSKTEAWDNFRKGREDWRTFMRDADIARYRKMGFYADDAYGDMPKAPPPKAKAPAPVVSPAVTFTHKVEVNKTFDLDLKFASAMQDFFIKKQDNGEIRYTYEYKEYGGKKDATQLLKHLTEFLTEYTK